MYKPKGNIQLFIYAIVLTQLCAIINISILIMFGFDTFIENAGIPMNEELFRFLSIIIGSPFHWWFTSLLAIEEFICYNISYYSEVGFFSYKLIMIRLFCVIAHFIFLFIQLLGWKIYRRNGKKKYIAFGYISTVFFHILWNTVIAPKFI